MAFFIDRERVWLIGGDGAALCYGAYCPVLVKMAWLIAKERAWSLVAGRMPG